MLFHARLLAERARADKRREPSALRPPVIALAIGLLLGWLEPGAATAQDGTVNFNNRVPAENITAPVFLDAMGTAPVAGSGYLAQLYAGPAGTLENQFKPTGAIVDFRIGLAAGFVNVGEDGTCSIPGVPVGDAAVVQMRAWSGAGGATYEQARANLRSAGRIGRSPPVTVTTQPSLLLTPVSMSGLQSFALIPPEMPTPQIALSNGCVLVSWPLDDSVYDLEISSAPGRDGPWQAIAVEPDLVNGRYQHCLPFTASREFYRLKLR